MNTNSEEYKQKVYQRWLENGRPWFNINKTGLEPTYAERQIIIEMKKRENDRINSREYQSKNEINGLKTKEKNWN